MGLDYKQALLNAFTGVIIGCLAGQMLTRYSEPQKVKVDILALSKISLDCKFKLQELVVSDKEIKARCLNKEVRIIQWKTLAKN